MKLEKKKDKNKKKLSKFEKFQQRYYSKVGVMNYEKEPVKKFKIETVKGE